MQSIVFVALLVCAVSAQYYQNNQQQQPQYNQQQPTTRFNQYSSSGSYNQPSYNQGGYNSQYGQYSSTTPNYNNNNRMYDPSNQQRFYNGVSMTSTLTALSAVAVALVL